MDKWGAIVAQAGGIAIAKVLGQNRSLNYSFHQKEVSVAQAAGVRGTAEAETHPGLGARVARSFLATARTVVPPQSELGPPGRGEVLSSYNRV